MALVLLKNPRHGRRHRPRFLRNAFGVPMGFGGPHAPSSPREGYALRCRAASRRVGRRGKIAPAYDAADARAAYPPREGELQHLHLAGAARQPRPACTPSITARSACAPSPRASTASPRCSPPACRGRLGRGRPGASSTPSRSRGRARTRHPRAAAEAGFTCAASPAPRSASVDETTTRLETSPFSGPSAPPPTSASSTPRGGMRADSTLRGAAQRRRAGPPGVQHAPHRAPRCCATSEAAEPRPALDHSMISLGSCDEAERHQRDDPDHLARSSPTCTRSRRASRLRLPRR